MTFEELSEELYEDLNGRITVIESTDVSMSAKVECDCWRIPNRRRHFRLTFDSVAESTLSPGYLGCIRVIDDHPLLWQHTRSKASLFFNSVPERPVEVIGRIYEAHRRFLERSRDLSAYLHADSILLTKGSGLFASGPENVIEEYARIIADQMRCSIIRSPAPTRKCRLVFFDERYIVCNAVSATEETIEALD